MTVSGLTGFTRRKKAPLESLPCDLERSANPVVG